ncbi:hypothetical protein TSUD_279720 [Trifolium subterraneum]|uniref:Uncharacterized protein n=1 Tax=Trifolium subterraneum TaxID=3900 RepID=A0A2Z6NTE3_TRISU|nr:hypothetical protein TSUD_279720 [Trifolium subterraneum]
MSRGLNSAAGFILSGSMIDDALLVDSFVTANNMSGRHRPYHNTNGLSSSSSIPTVPNGIGGCRKFCKYSRDHQFSIPTVGCLTKEFGSRLNIAISFIRYGAAEYWMTESPPQSSHSSYMRLGVFLTPWYLSLINSACTDATPFFIIIYRPFFPPGYSSMKIVVCMLDFGCRCV